MAGIEQVWGRWAGLEARGSSPTYERLALAVLGTAQMHGRSLTWW